MRHAWLVSRYPALSHSFIRREVRELRRRGIAIDTFTIRRPDPAELLNPEDREEDAATQAVLPAPALALVAAHARAFLSRPAAYLRTLAAAFESCPRGGRALLWRAFWFVEAIRLARALESRSIGHLHVHFADAGAEVGRLAAGFLGVPWSLTLHGHADLSGRSIEALGRLVRTARFVACISAFTRAMVQRSIAPDLWQRLHVVRCGLDVAAIAATPAPDHAPPVRFLAVGRLAPEKGHVGLVDAFADALAAGLDGELVLVGEGGERERIAARIAARGVATRFRLAGAKGEAELGDEYERCDVFVMSSRMEGIPVVLMEAMARGRPVVAPRVGGISELVDDGRHGLLFEGGDWTQLAGALLRIGGDPDLRRRLGADARTHVASLHAIGRVIEPLVELVRAAEGPERNPPAPAAGPA